MAYSFKGTPIFIEYILEYRSAFSFTPLEPSRPLQVTPHLAGLRIGINPPPAAMIPSVQHFAGVGRSLLEYFLEYNLNAALRAAFD